MIVLFLGLPTEIAVGRNLFAAHSAAHRPQVGSAVLDVAEQSVYREVALRLRIQLAVRLPPGGRCEPHGNVDGDAL